MTVRKKRLPFVVSGRRLDGKPGRTVTVSSPTGLELEMPRFDAELASEMIEANRQSLADLPLQEILSFLNRAGKNWKSEEYVRRRFYVRQLQDILGYSDPAANAEADRIAILLTSHARMYDMIAAELGSRYIVDDWTAREECWVRALPRGLVLHILPSNVPLSCAISIVRGIITKNVSVAKMGAGDLLTAVALALTFTDLSTTHPVTRSMNAVYWEHDNPEGLRLLGAADAVCAWGAEEAIAHAQRHARIDAAVTSFGPKESFAIIDASMDPAAAAKGLAHDVAIYDQRACFSIRRVYLTGPAEPFLELLRKEMDRHEELLPPSALTDDKSASIQIARREELFFGAGVHGSDALAWTIVVCPANEGYTDHPLSRILYVYPVESLSEAYQYAHPGVQTVAAHPWHLLPEHRDEFAKRGVSRFVELGLVHLFRIGGTHDSINPLQGLVRLVSTEAPGSVHGKGMVVNLDETAMLQAGTLKDLVL
ncbi:acyl-CoA reductase [Nocardia uniformis]|uniref:Acyl-CoA reductase n=1 Tax=Nocardia uniformis TaxID=53432 RepID=A0A849CAK4_9NOCA|nr:acyl-CoA reductase [Nocardia uniformis]NNH75654.1 acyl-CoA reductase [Nocardia uniformis]